MKRVLKTVLSLMMIAVLALSMFACKEEEKTETDASIFAKQKSFDRYLFQQGYADDWQFFTGEEGYALSALEVKDTNHEGALVVKFTPQSSSDMQYSIYYYNTNQVTVSDGEVMSTLMAETATLTQAYPLNEVFFEEEARDTYSVTSDTYKQVEYSHNDNWYTFDYTFVDAADEDWKGSTYVIMSSEGCKYFVITCEAKASVWTDADAIFQNMLEDFIRISAESDNSK